jgi:hypothetical protein
LEHTRGNILSIEAVKTELEDPDAAQWARDNSTFFKPNDVSKLPQISTWVMQSTQYQPDAKSRFLSKADPLLISFALARGHTVVTHEVSSPGAKRRIQIPDVCNMFSVPCLNTFQALDNLKARFILERDS